MLFQYLIPAIFAFVLTVFLTLLALKFFPRFGFMDRPSKYGLKRKPIPYYGGIVIVAVFFISVLLFVKIDIHVLALLLGALMIASVSFADDMFHLSPFLRLFVQILAAGALVAGGIGIRSISNPFGTPFILDQQTMIYAVDSAIVTISLLGGLFTILWVVAIVNTMNFLDGLNGLPSGVSAIAALSIFFLSIRPDIHFDISSQIPVATISIILFACAFAFMFFDFHPAKILMGDTGSMFLGFLLATLAIFSGGKITTAFLILGFPILDAVWVILRRIVSGKSPFRGDLHHLHHRLVEIGLSERKAVLFIYAICALFGGIAIFSGPLQKAYAIAFLVILMFTVGAFAVFLGKKQIELDKHK